MFVSGNDEADVARGDPRPSRANPAASPCRSAPAARRGERRRRSLSRRRALVAAPRRHAGAARAAPRPPFRLREPSARVVADGGRRSASSVRRLAVARGARDRGLPRGRRVRGHSPFTRLFPRRRATSCRLASPPRPSRATAPFRRARRRDRRDPRRRVRRRLLPRGARPSARGRRRRDSPLRGFPMRASPSSDLDVTDDPRRLDLFGGYESDDEGTAAAPSGCSPRGRVGSRLTDRAHAHGGPGRRDTAGRAGPAESAAAARSERRRRRRIGRTGRDAAPPRTTESGSRSSPADRSRSRAAAFALRFPRARRVRRGRLSTSSAAASSSERSFRRSPSIEPVVGREVHACRTLRMVLARRSRSSPWAEPRPTSSCAGVALRPDAVSAEEVAGSSRDALPASGSSTEERRSRASPSRRRRRASALLAARGRLGRALVGVRRAALRGGLEPGGALRRAIEAARTLAAAPAPPLDWPVRQGGPADGVSGSRPPPDLFEDLVRAVVGRVSRGDAALAALSVRRGIGRERIVNAAGLDVSQSMRRSRRRRAGRRPARRPRPRTRASRFAGTTASGRRGSRAPAGRRGDASPVGPAFPVFERAVAARPGGRRRPPRGALRRSSLPTAPPRWLVRGRLASPGLVDRGRRLGRRALRRRGSADPAHPARRGRRARRTSPSISPRPRAPAAARPDTVSRPSFRMPPRAGSASPLLRDEDGGRSRRPSRRRSREDSSPRASTAPVRVDVEADRYEIEFTGVSIVAGRAGGPVAGARARAAASRSSCAAMRALSTDLQFFPSPYPCGSPTLLIERASFE